MNNKLCTVGSMMSQKSWWKWALFGLLALYALLLVSRCSPIEQDLSARTTEALNDKGLSWATPALEKRGRDVMLSGEAPSEEARDQAIQTAAGVYGVRVVENDITIKQYTTPIFGLNNDDGKTTLTGSFPEQSLIDQVVKVASDSFGEDNVNNKMTVSEDVSSPSWLTTALGVIPAIIGMKDADLDINNDKASLNGTFHTEEEKQSLLGLVSSGFGDKFVDNSTVKPLGPTPEELAEIARLAEEAEAARIAEEQRLAAEAQAVADAKAARVAQIARLTAAANLAEEQRLAAEAQAVADAKAARVAQIARLTAAANLAEEQRLAAEAQAAADAKAARVAQIARLTAAANLAEEKRLAAEVDAGRTTNERSMAAIMLAAQQGREAKAKAAAEAARLAQIERLRAAADLAEQQRLAAEAEATRIANEKSMAAIMLAAQQAKEAKAKAAAEAARIANEKNMAAIMLAAQTARDNKAKEAARMAEEKLVAELAKAVTVESCQQSIDTIMQGKRILFATASATIDSQSYELLNALTTDIRRCEKNIQVSGHTDSRGSADMNMKLSEARAKAVRDYLSQQGVGGSTISSRGYGESSPVANNNSAAGRRLNRRIQFTILK